MTKKELQDALDFLKARLERQEDELDRYKEKEQSDKFKLEGDMRLAYKFNQDLIEIIRWHTNKEAALNRPEFDEYGRKIT